MRVKPLVFALLLACALPAFAQRSAAPAAAPLPDDAAACKTEEASLSHDIALARSRGQMLRRRQLADALTAMQAHCDALVPVTDRATRIKRQEQEVASLRQELERAEAYLKKLKAEGP